MQLSNKTPMQRFKERKGALKEVQQEINKRLTRYLWTAHSEPETISEAFPQGGVRATYARKNVPDGILPRCLVTPVATASYQYRDDLVPEGMRRRDRIIASPSSKVKYFEVDEYAGDVVAQLLDEHGGRTNRAQNSGLIELAPDKLPHMLDEEVEALRIDEVFFGPQLLIPLRNHEVIAAISARLVELENGSHWIALGDTAVDSRGIELLIRIGKQMRAAVQTTHIWQENVCRRANIALTISSEDEKYKPEYDDLDRLCFERTGAAMVQTAQRVIGDATVATSTNAVTTQTAPAAPAAPAPAAAAQASAGMESVFTRLAESQAQMAALMATFVPAIQRVDQRLAALEEEAVAEPVKEEVATPPRGANGKFAKQS